MEIDALTKKEKPSLADVYDIYKKWIYVQNFRRIDVVLATRLISKDFGTRVWLIIVGASGDWKSEQINALTGDIDVKIIRNFTSKTLVNGNPKVIDLVPSLKNKTILIPDLSQILKLHPNEKAEVWAQLRDLYDGYAGKQSGMGKDVEYKDLNITLIGASTPAIDKQILIHQDLGTRELIWRTEDAEKTKIMEMVLKNEKAEEIMRLELNKITINFLNSHTYNKDIEIPDEIMDQLKFQALLLTYLRAPAETDSFSGELLSDVYPEQPSRILKQLKKIYVALKSLDEDYSDIDALDCITHLVKSSMIKARNDVLMLLIENNDDEMTTNKIAERLRIGYKTAFKELNALWNLRLIHRRMVEEQRGYKTCELCYWLPNKQNQTTKAIYELYYPEKIIEEEKLKYAT
jgi:predicted transcriptional regulator